MQITPTIRLDRLLGQGGMGSVWVADHLKFHIKVVVKFMAEEFAANPEALGRFEREAALAAQAKSPHVVQIYDHGVSEIGLPYIAMELLEGEDLASRMTRLGRVPPPLYASWLWQACNGLGKAHAKGIVHRDVKPENIFLCNDDGEILVKVLDFGIAKSHGTTGGFSATRTGVMMGTAYYMSPEQTMGSKNIDQRTDLWAIGAMSYHALTGVRPFDADSLGALVYAITAGPIVPPSTHNPELSPEIDAWMAKALARNVDERFSSAKDLAEGFLAAVAGNDTAASGAMLGGIHNVRVKTGGTSATVGAATTRSVADATTLASAAEADIQLKDGTMANWGQTAPPGLRSTNWALIGGVAAGVLAAVVALVMGLSGSPTTTEQAESEMLTPEAAAPAAAVPEPAQPAAVESATPPPEVRAPAPEASAEKIPEVPAEPAAPQKPPAPSAAAPVKPVQAAPRPKPAAKPATKPAAKPAPAAAPAPAPKPASAFGGRL